MIIGRLLFDMVCTMLDKRVRRKILYLGSKDDTRDEQRYQGVLRCDDAA